MYTDYLGNGVHRSAVGCLYMIAENGRGLPQMTPVLGLEDYDLLTGLSFVDGYRSANEYLSSNTTNVTTAVFNRMYVRPGLSVLPSYSSTLRDVYGAEAQAIASAEQTAADINSAVAEVTRGKIAELVAPEQLYGADLVLVSALYFKALWQHPFVADEHPTPFLTADGERQLQMMSLPETTYLLYANMTQFEVVALPYSDPAFSLLLLRPAQRSMDSVHALLEMLDTLDMADIFNHMYGIDMQVTMPKFKVETEYSLPDQLTTLGIQEIFSPGADFSRLTEDGGIFVSDIIHKVFIEVTEEGTEAAGAGAAFFTRSMPMNFVVDRPFVAVVYNQKLGLNLFSAYVASPESGGEDELEADTVYDRPQRPSFLPNFSRLKAAIAKLDGNRLREAFSAAGPGQELN